MGELFGWWLAAEVIGIVALPLAAVLCANLPDRGWGLARPLGLLVLGWLVWFPLSLITALPYSRAWIAGTLVAFAAGNAALLRLPRVREALRRLIIQENAYVLAGEGVFAGALALMGWLRSFTPWVADQEKFMDVAFLSAIWRAPHLPPPDPWLAGHAINYYYFGHFLMATLAKLLGTSPAVAFNTSVALTFALVAVGVFAVASNLVAGLRPLRARTLGRAAPFGLASVLLVLVLGNLDGAAVWWRIAAKLPGGGAGLLSPVLAWMTQRGVWGQYCGYSCWWDPSRVIPNTIDEFPAFSFLLSDLHAHVLGLPFTTLALGLALNLLLGRGEGLRVFGARVPGMLALGTTAVVLGGLYAINGWDLPTYLGIALLALGIQQWIEHGRRWSPLFALDLFSSAVMLAALCVLLYLPFYRGFSSPAGGIGLVPGNARAPIGAEVAMFGLPLFLVGSLLLTSLAAWAAASFAPVLAERTHVAGAASSRVGTLLVVGPVVLLLLGTALTASGHGWTLVWSLLLAAGCAALIIRRLVPGGVETTEPRWTERTETFIWCLVGVAALLVAACEVVYLRDAFDGGAFFRMNTVFKFYYQVWLLLGVAGAPALALLFGRWGTVLAPLFGRWGAALAPLVAGHAHPARWRPLAGIASRAALATAQPAHPVLVRSVTDGDGGAAAAETRRPAAGVAHITGGEGVRERATGPGSRPAALSPIRAAALRWLSASGTLGWIVALLVLLGMAAIYPAQAAVARTENFTLPRTLDGTAYMASDDLNHGDAAAIAWLNDPAHVAGDPAIVEASGDEYSRYDRISAFTGLPTVLGWAGHEWQWRANWLRDPAHAGEIDGRHHDVDQIYTVGDRQVVLGLLERYHVRYVYIGAAERRMYPSADLQRFAAFLRVVYQRDGVTIYQVGG